MKMYEGGGSPAFGRKEKEEGRLAEGMDEKKIINLCCLQG